MNTTLSNKDLIFGDLERELTVTRRVLDRLPEEHFDFKPHAKSMSLRQLSMHVANLVRWASDTLAQDGLDGATMAPMAKQADSKAHLLETFDRHATELRQTVDRFDASNYGKTWKMSRGGQVMTSQPRAKVYRVWSLNHLIHHRAQLCLYLRLLNVAVPTVYFNTADDPTWVFE